MTALILSALVTFIVAVFLSGPPKRRFHKPEPERPLCDLDVRGPGPCAEPDRSDQTIARLRRRGGA